MLYTLFVFLSCRLSHCIVSFQSYKYVICLLHNVTAEYDKTTSNIVTFSTIVEYIVLSFYCIT